MRIWLVVLVLGLAVSSCADDGRPSPTEESAVDESSPTPSPEVTATAPPPGADSVAARQSVADLARTLGVDAADVEVVAVEEVTWSDGSRGCAQPGMMYTQALIEGSRITLRVDGTTYEYHAGGSGPPALCEQPTQ